VCQRSRGRPPGRRRRRAASAPSATAYGSCTGSRAGRPTASRSPSWCSPCSRSPPTTETATSPIFACASGLGPGRRCAARRLMRSRRRSAQAGSHASSRLAFGRSSTRSPPVASCRWIGSRSCRSPRRAPTCARCRGWDARRPPACCCSRSACATYRSTPTSQGSPVGWACCRPEPGSTSCTTGCSRSPRRAQSSSCMSTCCATAVAPATRAVRSAGPARWSGCARAWTRARLRSGAGRVCPPERPRRAAARSSSGLRTSG
jgi:hypothetical protein